MGKNHLFTIFIFWIFAVFSLTAESGFAQTTKGIDERVDAAMDEVAKARGELKGRELALERKSGVLRILQEKHGIPENIVEELEKFDRANVANEKTRISGLPGYPPTLVAATLDQYIQALTEIDGIKTSIETSKQRIDEKLVKLEEALAKKDLMVKQQQSRMFQGVKFGLGLAINVGGEKRIEEAELVGASGSQVVRVSKEKEFLTRILLEAHVFPDEGKNNWGPFVGLLVNEGGNLIGLGGGLMRGFKNLQNLEESTFTSINIGVGFFIEPAVKVLGDGITEGAALPAGETVIRFKEKSDVSAIIMVSFGL